ncbi:hypothetical protein [Dermacoccus sp. UBA1591]|uniref:hypothetical protein n=1 Tax=Dermacoccus sp. UBA1591 TaxID=1946405 RepID=UPI00257A998C|nr:hypothetical protein [Dermacoccus sp. UBA1591]
MTYYCDRCLSEHESPAFVCTECKVGATTSRPPIPRYRLTLTIDGNTFDEIDDELRSLANASTYMDSLFTGQVRHEWAIYSPRVKRHMEHRNPDMTPEKYDYELKAWADRRRKEKNR